LHVAYTTLAELEQAKEQNLLPIFLHLIMYIIEKLTRALYAACYGEESEVGRKAFQWKYI